MDLVAPAQGMGISANEAWVRVTATDPAVIATLETNEVLLPIAEVTAVQWRDPDPGALGYLWLGTASGKLTVQFRSEHADGVRAVCDFLVGTGIPARDDVLSMPDRKPVTERITRAANQAGSWLSKQLGSASTWLDEKTSGRTPPPGQGGTPGG